MIIFKCYNCFVNFYLQGEFYLKKKKIFISLTSIITILILIVFMICIFYRPGEVADYDKKIEIWDTVADNSSKSKLDDMNIDYSKKSVLFSTIKFASVIVNKEYKDVEQDLDTFTYLYEIKCGYEKETYKDEPYLIPYLADDAKGAVFKLCKIILTREKRLCRRYWIDI